MSPRRRKPGLSKDDLEALKHLPAVLKAVRKVTALGVDLRAAAGVQAPPLIGGTPISELPRTLEGRMAEVRAFHDAGYLHPADTQYIPPPGNPTLDTPERQEFERARKAGVAVPPPDLANISEAQRERMAEQKALIEAERAARGRPRAAPSDPIAAAMVMPGGSVPLFEPPVREEELPTSPNGSAGVEMQSGGFIDG